ncbi:MAG: hypothetical protein LBU50_06725 [Cellulomonas sp.]|nr:hypothetical protein [Cellulomonas sp.]
MLIDWTDEFEQMLRRLDERVARGEEAARRFWEVLDAQLATLQLLPAKPIDDGKTLKRVRQSRRYEVWRVSHVYTPGLAVRTIVWFPDAEHMVIALFANDKAAMSDVFYDSVGSRADQAIEQYVRARHTEEER